MRLGKPKLWSGPSADGIGDLHAVVFCTQFALRCCFSSSAGWNAFRLDSVFVAMILREGGYGQILSKMKLSSSYLAEIGLTQTLGCPSADLEVTWILMYTTCNLILLKFGGLEGIEGVIQSLLQWFWVERRLWPIRSKLRSRSSWRGALSILKAMGGLHASIYNRNLMLLRSERELPTEKGLGPK